ncbi:SDR family NAD(P)-dependent oxidoreductase [Terribacillus saccharophilus]|uniref:SDR family NAD(P)-dependent oxidoreductase n=1 Tax=Terribacillus saccharophilus TaxID=361277 RepID=UPI003981ABA1
MREFEGKVILITGAAGSIGSSAARSFAEAGAKLALLDLSEEALETAAADINTEKLLLTADMTIEAEMERAVQATVDRFGRIDVFINQAGISGDFLPLTEQTVESMEQVLQTNVVGAFIALKHVLRVMIKQRSGAVVNGACSGSLLGGPGMSTYVASKHALLGLNKTAALEVSEYGIRVNAVCPSALDTGWMEDIESKAAKGNEKTARSGFEASVPLNRYGTVEEVTGLMLFLASDRASFITGSYFRVDGGQGTTSV